MSRTSRKTRAPSAAFAKAQRFERLSMAERVREALPMARAFVTEGIESLLTEPSIEHGITAPLEDLIGLDDTAYLPESDKASARTILALEASFAMGVAVGLLLHVDAFSSTRGAR